ncbi:MAG: hypothetical protein IJO00_00595 [Clostridia bacterium]|nr:hypothetical protein [Clostridia bacterium]
MGLDHYSNHSIQINKSYPYKQKYRRREIFLALPPLPLRHAGYSRIISCGAKLGTSLRAVKSSDTGMIQKSLFSAWHKAQTDFLIFVFPSFEKVKLSTKDNYAIIDFSTNISICQPTKGLFTNI